MGNTDCERIQTHLDAYISKELPTEVDQEVFRHLQACATCKDEVEVRRRIRFLVHNAVQQQAAPPFLEEKIRSQIRRRGLPSISLWKVWVFVAAGLLLFSVGSWRVFRSWQDRLYTDKDAQANFIRALEAGLPGIVKVGLSDHLHCAVFRKFPRQYPIVAVAAEQLGPKYLPLVAMLEAQIPKGSRLLMAHRCTYQGRKYVHLVVKNDEGLLSLLITDRQPNESFARENLSPSSGAAGVSIFQTRAQNYEVAGFETTDELAFVVSDLSQEANFEIASRLAPVVSAYLNRMNG